MKIKKKDKEKFTLLVLTLIAVVAYYFVNNFIFPAYSEEKDYSLPEGELVVEYLDVGQADSILITSDGHNALIDAGNEEDGPLIVDYLKKLGIKTFDFVMGTHPHEDHIGGLDDVINNFNIQTVYLPKVTTTTKTFDNLLTAIENNKLKITIPKEDETIKLGEAIIKILYTGEDENDLNSSSIVSKMTFGKYSFLFTGDTTSGVEKYLQDKDIDIDILKVAHHGSEYSTTASFLKKATPEYAIISVGKNNSYNHPSEKTINRIKKYTDKIFKTSDLGTIIVSINKDELKIDSERTETNGQ